VGGVFEFGWGILFVTIIFMAFAVFARQALHRFISWKFGVGTLSSLNNFAAKKYRPLWHWFVFGCVIAPFSEEIVFRLPIIIFLDKGITAILLAVFVSAFLFSICHFFECPSYGVGRTYAFYLVAWTFIHSVILGVALVITSSLLSSIVIHSAVNSFVLFEIYRVRKSLA